MCLLIPNNYDRFRNIIIQENINVFELYSNNLEYNEAIDKYFNYKYNYVLQCTESNELMNEIIKEEIFKIDI